MTTEPDFRSPTEKEYAMLRRLLDVDFPGRNELVDIFNNISVKSIDDVGSLALKSHERLKAPVVQRIPVEAEASDSDGVLIHVLLHVLDGVPVELEVFKEDGSTPQNMPDAKAFELLVLPPQRS